MGLIAKMDPIRAGAAHRRRCRSDRQRVSRRGRRDGRDGDLRLRRRHRRGVRRASTGGGCCPRSGGALKHKAAHIPRVHRRKRLGDGFAAARKIARRHGKRAMVALPGIVRSARSILLRKRLPDQTSADLVAARRAAGRAFAASASQVRQGRRAFAHRAPAHRAGGLRSRGRTRYGSGRSAPGIGPGRAGLSLAPASIPAAGRLQAASRIAKGGGAKRSYCPKLPAPH